MVKLTESVDRAIVGSGKGRWAGCSTEDEQAAAAGPDRVSLAVADAEIGSSGMPVWRADDGGP